MNFNFRLLVILIVGVPRRERQKNENKIFGFFNFLPAEFIFLIVQKSRFHFSFVVAPDPTTKVWHANNDKVVAYG
jgi:hypothetical protein